MKLTFVGVSTCTPDVGASVASLMIDGKHLVDTGWCAALNMRRFGFDPLALESVMFTHLHQDHYLGLPSILFFAGLRGRDKTGAPPLRIIGPGQYLKDVVDASLNMLQLPRFPELEPAHIVDPLKPGESFDLGSVHVDTCAASHESGHHRVEPAVAYRFTDTATGGSFAYTGDTSYHPPLADFAKGLPLLIHDGSHTRPADAAKIAQAAGVQRLLLIHYANAGAEQKLAEAKAVFPNTELAREGETLEF